MKHLIFSLLAVAIAATVKSQTANNLSSADKIYGLSKFWQEVNYNFIYLDKIDKTYWDKTYRKLLSTVPSTKNDYQYYRELQKFCALLKDGHTAINFPNSFQLMNDMFGDYRLFTWNYDGKAIIVGTNFSKKDEIPLGSEVVEVNGKPTQAYIDENVAPYISSSTEYLLKDWSINRLFQGLAGDSFQVRIKKPDGRIISLRLIHKQTEEKDIYPKREIQKKNFEFKWLNSNIAYVGLNSFENPQIDSFFIAKLPELYNAEGLVIDLRYNCGGNTGIGMEILKYLTNDSVLNGSKKQSRLHIPAYKAWGRLIEPKDTIKNDWAKKCLLSFQDKLVYEFESKPETVNVKIKKVVIPTAILIGHFTASAAEDFLILADNQKHMIKIGENTSGSTGQPLVFELPGGGSAIICTKKDSYPDGREFVGHGIKPDRIVKSTFDDYLFEKDPVLEDALVYLNSKIK